MSDPVNPDHYRQGDIECIDAIQAMLSPDQFVGLCRGLAMKYIWRAPHKGSHDQDIRKAIWYLERAVAAERGDDSPVMYQTGGQIRFAKCNVCKELVIVGADHACMP